jgi:Cu/Ag efflux pump CusA
VFGGMLAATILAVLIVPVLYVVVQNTVNKMRKAPQVVDPIAELAQ